ncbi:sulfide dehydrogenase [Chlorobium phaeovibrioides]|uniref:c-type cytochrome n=1 Tax=Chlorobium phaeovibrioides TaxID=1094 RepID=UPI000F847C2B|nr:c-type cytochrome [Chlorobium phaeovibrioides]RTY36715.1 sulfide dehydrogenase [Chlorobium phaeovibrioides]
MEEKIKLMLVAAALLFASVPGGADAKEREEAAVDPRGQILAFSCASCHGTDGKSVSIIPSFYGKSPEYLEMALKDFKSGRRYSTVMMRHAKGYTDEEIRLIAEYYGTVWQNNN